MMVRNKLSTLNKRELIFTCLNNLVIKNRNYDLDILTDKEECNRLFGKDSPVLARKIASEYNVINSALLYLLPITIDGQKYYIFKKWYYNNNKERRDISEKFIDWINYAQYGG